MGRQPRHPKRNEDRIFFVTVPQRLVRCHAQEWCSQDCRSQLVTIELSDAEGVKLHGLASKGHLEARCAC